MTALYSQALSGNGLSLLLFLLISLGAFVAFVAVIAKSFGKINTHSQPTALRWLQNDRAEADYAQARAVQAGNEALPFFVQYVLNTAVGLLLLTVVSVKCSWLRVWMGLAYTTRYSGFCQTAFHSRANRAFILYCHLLHHFLLRFAGGKDAVARALAAGGHTRRAQGKD